MSINYKSKLSDEDLKYVQSISAAMLEQTPKQSRLLSYIIMVFFIAMVAWSLVTEVDEVTRGEGKVIPSKKLQVIQNLEGGIVSEILVKEGMKVNKNQILLRIDDTGFKSSYEESNLQYLELVAKAARLEAEASMKDDFVMPKEVLENNPDLANNEKTLFLKRKKQLEDSLSIIQHQTTKFEHEYREAKKSIDKVLANYKLAKKELSIIKPLLKSGAVSEVKILQTARQVNDLSGELSSIRNSLPRLDESIKESKQKEKEIISSFQSKARAELNEALAEIPRIQETMNSLEDKVTRRDVRSPVTGLVQQLLVNTIGGVVKPGMDLVEIVPLDDALIIETKIKPSDISFIYFNQKAKVKFTAYDSSKYGSLDAKVIHISADTIQEKENGKDISYYLVKVKTDQNYILDGDKELPIIAGMVAETEIMSGKRTIFNYIFNPIIEAKNSAFKEH